MKKKIGLALGGGGAKGLCHTAFVKALGELRLKSSVIAGAKQHQRAGILLLCRDHAWG